MSFSCWSFMLGREPGPAPPPELWWLAVFWYSIRVFSVLFSHSTNSSWVLSNSSTERWAATRWCLRSSSLQPKTPSVTPTRPLAWSFSWPTYYTSHVSNTSKLTLKMDGHSLRFVCKRFFLHLLLLQLYKLINMNHVSTAYLIGPVELQVTTLQWQCKAYNSTAVMTTTVSHKMTHTTDHSSIPHSQTLITADIVLCKTFDFNLYEQLEKNRKDFIHVSHHK